MELQPAIVKHLNSFITEANKLDQGYLIDRWAFTVSSFLGTAGFPDERENFLNLTSEDPWDVHALRIGYLQGLVAKSEIMATRPTSGSAALDNADRLANLRTPDSRKVFVVHGHDNELKEVVARFLEHLGLQAIVLHEQPNSGRTIIEKFEVFSSDIVFAVILLTPDDVGASATEPNEIKPRARQNVILELGYFIGRLGRTRVCALHKGGVELPSDYQGVVYIKVDSAGAWKAKLAQELVQAKLSLDLTALLAG